MKMSLALAVFLLCSFCYVTDFSPELPIRKLSVPDFSIGLQQQHTAGSVSSCGLEKYAGMSIAICLGI